MTTNSALKRLQRGLPAILLGTLFNILDAVSTGLLVFPSDGNAFSGLQNKSMSTYIFSTLISQIVMTAGGSLFPGALGAMLIEVLPFMRGVASDIRSALGDDNPAVLPTVMVAYSLSSILIGIIFLLLGALGFGPLMSYFPHTVLTGAIGGIGVSLFILGLELPLPSDQSLTLSNAGSVLFSEKHIPLLMASILPIVFMCGSVRSDTLNKLTRGFVQHPYYVPVYFLAIAAIFWIIVGGIGIQKLGGLHSLAASGWLFSSGEALGSSTLSLGNALDYWSLFNFHLVEWSALRHAITNFVLLVVIGVLNLPVYVPALALALDVPYSMNHELLGQGAANILAGACGSLPNILQLSYSVFFTRAGGRRIEAAVVILFTIVLYLVSSYLLRYIPTILASGLVLFLGIELTLEAVWESAKDLIWTEWLIVMATLLSCTFIGFAPGVGVGLAAAMVVYTGWGCWDLRARSGYIDRNLAILNQHSQRLQSNLHGRGRISASYARLPNSSPEETGEGWTEEKLHPQIRLVHLNGYVFFGVIPSVESQLSAQVKTKGARKNQDQPHQYAIVDMHTVHRVETAAAKTIRTKARDEPGLTLVLCGFSESSGTAADLKRSGLGLHFGSSDGIVPFENEGCVRVFDDCMSAMAWCKKDLNRREMVARSGDAEQDWPRQRFLDLFTEPSDGLRSSLEDSESKDRALDSNNGYKFEAYRPSSSVLPRPSPDLDKAHLIFILSGNLTLSSSIASTASPTNSQGVRYNRDSLRATVIGTSRRIFNSVRRRVWHARNTLELPSPDVNLSERSSADEKRSVGAGSTLCVLRETITDVGVIPGAVGTGLGKSGVVETYDSVGSTPNSVRMWPAECTDAIVTDGVEDFCWLVEVQVPHSLASSSPSSIEDLRRQAVQFVRQRATAAS